MLLAMFALIGIDHLPTPRGAAAQVGVASYELGLTEPASQAIDDVLMAADTVEKAATPAIVDVEGDDLESLETVASGKDWTIYKGSRCSLSYGDLYLISDVGRLNVFIDIDRIPVRDGTSLQYRLAFAGEANRDLKFTEITEFTIYRGIEQGESLVTATFPASLVKDFEEFTIAALVLPDENKLVRRMPIPNGRAAVAQLATCVKTL